MAETGTSRSCEWARVERRRQLRNALEQARPIALWAGFVGSMLLLTFAIRVGSGRLALATVVLMWVCLFWLMDADEPDRGPKGEVATMPEAAFEQLLASVEHQAGRLASGTTTGGQEAQNPDGFERIVADALDELPEFVRVELERNVAVTISDDGESRGAFGLYLGGTVTEDWSHQIVIFRDTLVRAYGSDPDTLRHQVTMTCATRSRTISLRASAMSPSWACPTTGCCRARSGVARCAARVLVGRVLSPSGRQGARRSRSRAAQGALRPTAPAARHDRREAELVHLRHVRRSSRQRWSALGSR